MKTMTYYSYDKQMDRHTDDQCETIILHHYHLAEYKNDAMSYQISLFISVPEIIKKSHLNE